MSKYNLQTCLLAGKTDLGHTDILKTFNQNNHPSSIKIKNYILTIFILKITEKSLYLYTSNIN